MNMRPFLRLAPIALLAAACVIGSSIGCAQKSAPTKQLTERQRDSTLGASVIPGASAVTRALKESDKATNAAHDLDQQVQDADH